MKQSVDLFQSVGVAGYIIIIALVLLFLFGIYFVIWGNKGRKVRPTDLPTDTGGKETLKAPEIQLGTGDYKCLCFRKIKGVAVADFTTIPDPIGEVYQFDPSCPINGLGYIVKEEGDKIVDYDPREVEFKKESSPEYAYFAISWDIVKAVYFVLTQWWKSTAVWFAGIMVGVMFILGIVTLG